MLRTYLHRLYCCAFFLAFFVAAHASHAQGVSPYLPIKLSPILENEIERLANVSGMPQLTKPYSVAMVYEYLEKIHYSHPRLYSRLTASLKPYAERFSITHTEVGVRSGDTDRVMPNERGVRAENQAFVNFRGQWQMADWFAVYAGMNATSYQGSDYEDLIQASGSMLSIGVEWAQLDIGYKDFWLSPFQGSAQLLSTNAETMPSVSLSNNLPIEFLGVRWQYLGFLTQMSRQLVQYQGEQSDDEKPLIAGLHLSMQPTDWWSIGATRVFQFGGGERPVDLGTLVRAFFDPRGADNDASVDEESGNQIASVVSKINFDGRVPFSFALELAGEDTSNNKNYQLGNTAVTAGLYFPYFFSHSISLTAEYSDWQVGWYNNNVYDEGYTNERVVLGHWAMQSQRDLNLAAAGTSYYLKAQWQQENDHIVSFVARTAEHEPETLKSSWEAELEYVVPWHSGTLTFTVNSGKDVFGNSYDQLGFALGY